MFGKNLQALRKEKGYTQESLAIELHVVRQTVSKWEKGLSVPDADMLLKIADTLEVSVSELLGADVSEKGENRNEIAEMLAKINEQLAIKNRREKRIAQVVAAVLVLMLVIPMAAGVFGFRAVNAKAAGRVEWQCFYGADLSGYDTYEVEYTDKYRVMSLGYTTDGDNTDFDASKYKDARKLQAAIYEYYEAKGGRVVVVRSEGLELPDAE